MKTTRDSIYSILSGIKKLNAPKTLKIQPRSPKEIYETIKKEGFEYPVIFRQAGDHGGISTIRIDNNTEQFYQFALDGRDFKSTEERSEVLLLTGKAKPDMASLTLGSLNFITGPSINSLDAIQELAMLMKEKNIKPELEVFDAGMINFAKYLERHDIISGTKYFNILLGNINTAPATIGDLAHLYNSLPQNSLWAAAGLGVFQLPMNTAAIVAGGHVRVGIEDSIYYDYGKSRSATNVELVKRIVRLTSELQRDIATSGETRKMLGLS